MIKKIYKNFYNHLIFAQYNTVCFHIIEEQFNKNLPNGRERNEWEKLNNKLFPVTGAPKVISHKRLSNSELDDLKKYLEDCIIRI